MAELELDEAHEQSVMLGRKSAREKVAAFVWMLAEHCECRGGQDTAIELPMTRGDIADYLGLTTETVSREMTYLRERGLITMQNSGMLRVQNMIGLIELAGSEDM